MSDGTPKLYQATSAGRILDCGDKGRSFCIYPAVMPVADVASESPVSIPGSYPVRVRFRGAGRKGEFPVIDARLHIFDPEDWFESFDLLDCDAGDTWAVQVFDSPHAGFFPAGARNAVPVAVQNVAVAVPQVSPTLATDGWPLRPSLTAFTVFYSGVNNVNRLWVRQLNGTWFNTGQDWTVATDGPMQQLTVDVPGDRFALVAGGAGQTVRIEGKFQLG